MLIYKRLTSTIIPPLFVYDAFFTMTHKEGRNMPYA